MKTLLEAIRHFKQTHILTRKRRFKEAWLRWSRSSIGLPSEADGIGREAPLRRGRGSSRAWFGLALLCMVVTEGCRIGPPANHDVWAEVDGQPILRQEVDKLYRERAASGHDAVDADEALSFKLNILDELIDDQVLIQYALRSGITVSEAQVDTRIAQLKSPYSEKAFEDKLKQQGMDLASLRQEVRSSLIISKLIHRDIDSHVSVSPAEISYYFNTNKASFDVPETEYHLAQIEVTPFADRDVRNLKDDDAKNPVDARRKTQALYAQIQAGASFKTLAENYSEDPRTAPNGGDMGFVPVSALDADPRIKKVVTSLKVGEVSGIIQTSTGYHIIKLLGIEKAGQRTLNDPAVEATIRKTLMNEKEQLARAAYIEILRDRAKVENYLAERILRQDQVPLN